MIIQTPCIKKLLFLMRHMGCRLISPSWRVGRPMTIMRPGYKTKRWRTTVATHLWCLVLPQFQKGPKESKSQRSGDFNAWNVAELASHPYTYTARCRRFIAAAKAFLKLSLKKWVTRTCSCCCTKLLTCAPLQQVPPTAWTARETKPSCCSREKSFQLSPFNLIMSKNLF